MRFPQWSLHWSPCWCYRRQSWEAHRPAPGLCCFNRGWRTEALKLKGLQGRAGRDRSSSPSQRVLTEHPKSFCHRDGFYTQTVQKLLLPQSCLGEGPKSTPPPQLSSTTSSLLPWSHEAVGGRKVTALGQLRVRGARGGEMVWWLRMLATKAV